MADDVYTLVPRSDREFEVHRGGSVALILRYPHPATRTAAAYVKVMNESEADQRAHPEKYRLRGVITMPDGEERRIIRRAEPATYVPPDEPPILIFGDRQTLWVDEHGNITRERAPGEVPYDDEPAPSDPPST